MTENQAQPALTDADRLARAARRSARWYASYLLLYAVGTFVLSILVGLWAGTAALAGAMVLWLLLIAALSLYAARQKATIKRFGLLHGMVIGTWASLWIITVLFGSMYFGDNPSWWVGGGIATALPPVVGAAIVLYRTR